MQACLQFVLTTNTGTMIRGSSVVVQNIVVWKGTALGWSQHCAISAAAAHLLSMQRPAICFYMSGIVIGHHYGKYFSCDLSLLLRAAAAASVVLVVVVVDKAEVPAGWTWNSPQWQVAGGDCPRDKDGWTYGKGATFGSLLLGRESGLRRAIAFVCLGSAACR